MGDNKIRIFLEENFTEEIFPSHVMIFKNVIPEKLYILESDVYETFLKFGSTSFDFQAYSLKHKSKIDNRKEVECLWKQQIVYLNDIANLSKNYSLIIRSVSKYFISLSELDSVFSMYFNEQVFGNAFFSRESSSSFPAHIDKYPVFACQLLGTKKWWIYDRLQQTVCTQIVETNIGDILYIPKGVPHMAKANTISFHDSIAIT